MLWEAWSQGSEKLDSKKERAILPDRKPVTVVAVALAVILI